MASNLKTIRTRIKSIKNIRKITRAMELVSVSKMRRSINAVLTSRPYAQATWGVIQELSRVVDPKLHPLLKPSKKMKSVLILVITSDRGLCGSFNTQVIQKTFEFVKSLAQVEQIEFVTIGRKGEVAISRMKWKLVATFNRLSLLPTIIDIKPITKIALDGFLEKRYDHIFIIYTDFISTIKQTTRIHQLLPLKYSEVLGEVSSNISSIEAEDRGLQRGNTRNEISVNPRSYLRESASTKYEFVFEPKPSEVLDFILPRAVEFQIYQALLESIASEHSARMVAMKNASDSALDMVDDLTFTFNQLRQAGITREIAEIAASKTAIG